MEQEIRKLTVKELSVLEDFVAKHVEYYDLQCEIVDHLANGIEAIWEENEQVTFQEAFRNEFKKFGVSGFQEIVEKRQISLKNRYNKMILKDLLTFFKFPRIIGSILAMYALYLLIINYSEILFSVTRKIILASLFVMIGLQLFKKYRLRKSGRKFIFKEYIFNYGLSSFFIQIPINLIMLSPRHVGGGYATIYAVLIVVLFLYLYLAIVHIPKNAEKYLNEVYPEYQLMKSA